ncbi:uncharacterized protein LOC110916478 isoform X2 [Helianthus annuus]|uniref:uncharacterized protein LOC110916478 isoform X2 n=1 Tax=Helianthus annuus TaxID=4232 RepID=UPI0016532C2B|nr:uncharacterized protein LOC110916478 isoform X2 [Helianthus annuus]
MGEKQQWSNEHLKCLLETCIEEINTGHPKAASLKTVPLPFQELCAELFDGNTVTGNCKWTSTQTTSGVGSSCHRVQSLMIMDTHYHDTQDDAGTSEPTFEPTSEPNPNKRAKTSKPSTNHDDLARDMQKALQFFIKGRKGQ